MNKVSKVCLFKNSVDSSNIVIAWATVVMALTALVACGISYVQWSELQAQSAIIQDELYRAHRPWAGISGPIKIIDPLTFDDRGAHINISYLLRNTGNSAAIRLSTTLTLVVGPASLFNNNQDSAHLSCDNNPDIIDQFGASILPDDSNTDATSVSYSSSFKGEDVFARLYSCVRYTDEFGKLHATGSSWSYITVEKKNNFKSIGSVLGHFESTGLSTAF